MYNDQGVYANDSVLINLENKLLSLQIEEWTTFLTAEMLVFGLLGKALHSYPDEAWLYSLAKEGVFKELPLESDVPEVQRGSTLMQAWTENMLSSKESTFAALLSDYNRLFIGPDKLLAPPWGSIYLTKERLIFQEQTLEVRNWYRRFGLELNNLYHEPDDHIGLELSFLAHLAQLALQALKNQDAVALDNLLHDQHDFLIAHPLRWASMWCDLVDQHAQTDFNRGIALLANGALKEAELMLEQILAEAPGGDKVA